MSYLRLRHLAVALCVLVCVACDGAATTATPEVINSVPGMPTVPAGMIAIALDQTKTAYNISPYIYGVAAGDNSDPQYAQKLRPSLFRWGGNPATRYNWVLGNAWNAGRDWEFRNTAYGNSGNVADSAVRSTLAAGSTQMLTIPMIGWVAKNTDQETRSLDVPAHGAAPLTPGSDAITGYDPTENRSRTSVKSVARKNAPFVDAPDPASTTVYQDEWVAHLVKTFGKADAGGVQFYAMDNEPDIWSETHTDVHPARMGYDDMWARYSEYAAAVKDVDSAAQITGPTVWGWTSYEHSELDRGTDNFRSSADRAAHGGTGFLAWFLDQAKRYEAQNKRRILDVLDIHYYPQADSVYSDKADPDTRARRIRAVRSLWDSGYKDESWIGTQIRLIPRMRAWIDANYPGTKLGIGEWSFGGEKDMSGALAVSTTLGIFGREGVYLAAYWRVLPADSPTFYAFQMYTNFDGKGSAFGTDGIRSASSDDTKVATFAARDPKTGRLHLILLNAQPDASQSVRIQTARPLPQQSANVYELSAHTNNRLAAQPSLSITGDGYIDVVLPPYSATLIDLNG